MAHVDALSRHSGAVLQGGTLEKEDVLREQDKDTFCLKQSPGTYDSRKDFFFVTTVVFCIDVGRKEILRC